MARTPNPVSLPEEPGHDFGNKLSCVYSIVEN
jgi:hypothetical protein